MSVLVSIREGRRSMKDIAHDQSISSPELTRLVKSLTSKGLVVSERLGMSRWVSISNLKHATHLRRVLGEYNHMKLDRILSLTTLDVISSLAATPGQTRTDIVSNTGISPRTLQTALKHLRELGVVRVKTRGVYELSDRFAPFGEFAREFDEYSNQRKAIDFCQDSVVVWQRGQEFIIRTKCDRESAEFRLTAFSRFERYGVPLFLGWQYYYHPIGKWRGTADEVTAFDAY
jgi:DNA-binding MarR family transcriptional regulator